GGTDRVPTRELVPLLRPAKGRLKLAVLSACESAATATAETLRWLGLEAAADQAESVAGTPGANPAPPAVANVLVRALDCAVLAMRYPVTDEFAIALAEQLYRGLFELRLPVDRAVARAVPGAAGPAVSPARPAL